MDDSAKVTEPVSGADFLSGRPPSFVPCSGDPEAPVGMSIHEETGAYSQEKFQRKMSDDQAVQPIVMIPPSGRVTLVRTVVQGGALPDGYELQFSTLMDYSTSRVQRKMATIDNTEAAVWLHRCEQKLFERRQEYTASNQLLMAASGRPRKHRTLLQRTVYDGPNARRHTEDDKRKIWVDVFIVWSLALSHP